MDNVYSFIADLGFRNQNGDGGNRYSWARASQNCPLVLPMYINPCKIDVCIAVLV